MYRANSLGKKAYKTVGDYKPNDKQLICLTCKIDVKKCKGSKYCVGLKKEKENG